MKNRTLLPLLAVSAFLLMACAKPTVMTNKNDAAASPTTTTTTAPTASTAEKIGIPECDDFLAAYDACVSNKVPEVARAQYKASIEQWRSSWRKLAGNPDTRASLVEACKQSAAQARTAMKSYDCTF